MYRVSQLPSGLRVATAEMPHMESVAVGLWIGTGGRYEAKRVSGVSHFIEHMLFKGTRRRTAKEISQTVEGIGGYLNAFTGEETTCYYARASHRYLDTLLDVLADMYLQPRFAVTDIVKERDVIKEELRMYRDHPEHYAQELLTETLWPDHPLGRSLTGCPRSLDHIDRAVLLDYKRRKYVAANTVVVVSGHCRHDDIVRRVQNFLTPLQKRGGERAPQFRPACSNQRTPRLRFYQKSIEQSHLALAIRGYSRHDERRYALKLLSVLLGENMSSRLFQVIREQHGLAYSIQSSTSFFADTGAFVVSAGLDSKRLPKALRLILRELKRVAKRAPTARELRQAKDYAIGQMRLSLESTANQMMWLGEHLLAYGFIETPEEVERRVEAVDADALRQVAADVFRDNRLNAAVITPSGDEQTLAKCLRFV
ncbi:MAG: pitrilysin family protein [Verrucomicrobiia bacterium]